MRWIIEEFVECQGWKILVIANSDVDWRWGQEHHGHNRKKNNLLVWISSNDGRKEMAKVIMVVDTRRFKKMRKIKKTECANPRGNGSTRPPTQWLQRLKGMGLRKQETVKISAKEVVSFICSYADHCIYLT